MKNRVSQLRDIVAQHIEAGEICGAVTLFARHGGLVLLDAQGMSASEGGTPLRVDSLFGVCSMTKPVTAACAAILIAEGKLRPESPVADWIPEFAQPRRVRTLKPGSHYPAFPPTPGQPPGPPPQFDFVPAKRPIRLHDILNFTSGLQTIGIPNDDIPPVRPSDSLASWVARLGSAPLEFQPGAQWHYSNTTGYEVLARVIEIASGQPFDVFVKQRLLDPLGMNETRFGLPPGVGGRLVPMGPLADAPFTWASFPSGSAGLFSTAAEYWRFAQMLLEDGMHQGHRVMPEAAIEAMRTNQIGALSFPGVRAIEYIAHAAPDNPGIRYGYGVAIVTDATRSQLALPKGSFGWDGVGTRRFWVIPSLRAVLIMLVPGMGVAADALHRGLEEAVCTPFLD